MGLCDLAGRRGSKRPGSMKALVGACCPKPCGNPHHRAVDGDVGMRTAGGHRPALCSGGRATGCCGCGRSLAAAGRRGNLAIRLDTMNKAHSINLGNRPWPPPSDRDGGFQPFEHGFLGRSWRHRIADGHDLGQIRDVCPERSRRTVAKAQDNRIRLHLDRRA